MTPKEIAALIKTCKNAGIAQFKLGNLEFKFTEFAAPQAMPVLTEQDKQVELERQIALQEDLEALQMQNLMMEDPSAYEELRRSNGAQY